MAKKPTPSASTAVANYDEELARLAGQSAGLTQSTAGGKFFNLRAGVLSYDETPLPGNQMCVIVTSWCLENVYYEGAFDPDQRTPPTCFAFGKDPDAIDEMGPPDIVDEESDVFTRQSDICKDCPQNEWGSARQGRGKACSNRRRLACVPAGTYTKMGKNGGYELELIDDADHYKSADEAFLKLPVMSGKGFDGYVKQVAEQLRRPLFAVYTRVWVEPDPKSQFRVLFELIEPVGDDLLGTLLERHKKSVENIDFPYLPFKEDDEPAKVPAKASAKKKLSGRR